MEKHSPEAGVLVLGSAGFTGSALVTRLLELGYHVYAVGRSEVSASTDRLVRIRGSVEDSSLLRELLPHCGQIVHTACLTTPGSSARDPSLEVTGNLLPLARLLECAGEFPRRRLIYLSSAGAVYGDLARDADEGTSLKPRSFYGAGKAAAEAFVHACVATSDWEAVVLRPSNIYGPGQNFSKGFAIVPTLFQRALDGQPVHIWGDGMSVRDYCFIGDLADLIGDVLRQPTQSRFSVYNAASGYGANVLELVSACERVSGRSIQVQFSAPRGVDVPYVSPCSAAAMSAYGWSARTTLNKGLTLTWNWFERVRSVEQNR